MPDDKYFKKTYGYGSRDNPSASAITGTLSFIKKGLVGEDDTSNPVQQTKNSIVHNSRAQTSDSNKRRSQGYRGL